MKHYHEMTIKELLSMKQILSAQYDLCLMYYLLDQCNFYMYQANHYNLRRDFIDKILYDKYHVKVDNLPSPKKNVLSQFSSN